MKKIWMCAAAAALVCAGSTNATTVTALVGGSSQSGDTYVNFDSLSGGQTTSYTSGALTVLFTGNSQTESSSANNFSFQPILSGNNNLNFGTIYSGSDSTTYLAAGNNVNNGSLTFNFSTAKTYFGLLWGSVDAGNELEFYSGQNGTGTLLYTLTGANLNSINSEIAQTGYGDQYDDWGTAYVNVDTTAAFESVVATTTTFTFEIDNVAYGTASVPDASPTLILLLVGLGGIFAFGKNCYYQPSLGKQIK